MAKTVLDLDSPFETGEQVITTRDLRRTPQGTLGTIALANGLTDFHGGNTYYRYWVRFDGGPMIGQVPHDDLVRLAQVSQWKDRQVKRDEATAAAERNVEAAVESEPGSETSGESGVASLIPADLLERSRAAKARLLGG